MMRCAIGAGLALVLNASFSPIGQASEESGRTLFVVVKGALPEQGQVLASLFDTPDTKWKRPRAKRISAVMKDGRAAFVFPNLDTGDYALSVVYDKDMDGELDTSWFGRPLEPLCYSNNVRPEDDDDPSFDQASFKVAGPVHTITIDIGAP